MQVALLEEISGMANGIIVQLTEDVVTELLVERKAPENRKYRNVRGNNRDHAPRAPLRA
jgi:hypothetical protein